MYFDDVQRAQDFGCIPNFQTPGAMAEVETLAAPWDAQDRPPVSTWTSFEKFLKTLPDMPETSNWFRVVDPLEYFTPSQSYRPNCSGFAMANAATCALISQIHHAYSEQTPVKFNPFVTWIKSKNGSVSGGQSIAAIAQAGNEFGNYIVEDVGDYDPGRIIRTTQPEEDAHALEHQIGFCLYDGETPWEAMLLACQKGFACFFGNSRAISGCERDANGVPVAVLSGSWSHAEAAAGFQIVNGTRYVFIINSHGDIYQSDGFTPRFGVWMPEDRLKTFMSSSFNDLAIVTYTEAPYNTEIVPTLVPEVV